MRAIGIFLLTIGDEILDGRVVNSNASFFGETLRLAGVPVAEVRCVSDRTEDIIRALREAAKFPLTVVTGGLGPTNDDRTLVAAAKAFRRKLVATKESRGHVESRYAALGLPMNEQRARLAIIPEKAKILENPTGMAPGLKLKVGKHEVYFLPGVPTECRPMFEAEILPRAQKLLSQKRLLRREFWRCYGLGESAVYQLVAPIIRPLEEKYPDSFYFGVHIDFPCIDLTFEVWQSKGKPKPGETEIREAIATIEKNTKAIAFAREKISLAQALMKLLLAKKKTLATAESCTGGMLGKVLTDIPGSSAAYLGGAISYANSAKEILLQVPKKILETHGAISEQTVRIMAENIRQNLKSDFALALSGISGPDGGTEKKPVGTIHIALSDAKGSKTMHQIIFHGHGSRDQNRVIATHLALDALRLRLQED